MVKYEGGKWEVRATRLRQAGELRPSAALQSAASLGDLNFVLFLASRLLILLNVQC
ncbi:MAG: hypothetical protein ACK5B5_10810 [Bacteroidota bacterium]